MVAETEIVDAENMFTEPLFVSGGKFDVSLSGISDSTITVQRRRREEDSWLDIQSFTADIELTGRMSGPWWVRAGVKTGSYGSDTIDIIVAT